MGDSAGRAIGTIVGGVIGFVIGGPAGASYGASIGGSLGSSFDTVDGGEGPRLDNLKVQTSAYGNYLPKLSGTQRLQTTMIWLENNKIKERKQTQSSGGKGGGPSVETTTYSYSASFAVALTDCSSAPVGAAIKIWGDTILIRDLSIPRPEFPDIVINGGSGGSLSDQMIAILNSMNAGATNIRLYKGGEDQEVDSLMQADNADTPAYRNTAIIVFENLQLEDFGNRIPNITVEVVAPEEEILINGLVSSHLYEDEDFGNLYPTYFDEGIMRFRDIDDNGDTLLFDLSGNYLGKQKPRNFVDDVPGRTGSTIYYGFINGGRIFVETNTSRNNPAVIMHHRPSGTFNILPYAGIVGGLLMMAFSADDKYIFLLMTAPDDFTLVSSGFSAEPKVWYIITVGDRGASIHDQGTVSGIAPISYHALSKSATRHPSGLFYASCMETDLKHIWTVYGAGGSVELFTINDDKVLTSQWLGNDPGFTFTKPGMYADNGIAMIVYNNRYNDPSTGGRISYFSRDSNSTALTTPLSTVVTDICADAGIQGSDIDTSQLTDDVDGYLINSLSSAKSNIKPLQLAYQFDVLESEYQLKFIKRGGASVVTLDEESLGAHEIGQERGPYLLNQRSKEVGLPSEIWVSYINKDRSYDLSSQRAARLVTQSDLKTSLTLPLVLPDNKAAQISEIILYTAWEERNAFSFHLPFQYLYLEPTDIIDINVNGESYHVRLTEIAAGKPGLIECVGFSDNAEHYNSVAEGDSGLSTQDGVIIDGPTNLLLLDIPILRQDDNDSGLYFALGGYYAGWRGAVLMKSLDGGQSYSTSQSLLTESVMGSATTILQAGETNVFDYENTVNIKTLNSQTLASVSEVAMLNGENAAAIGVDGRWEIIKFQDATLEADGTYTLSKLIRGYKGTEHNISNHELSDNFILLSSATLSRTAASDDELGATRHYKAVSLGKNINSALEEEIINTGKALLPYSPVQVLGVRDGSDNLTINWVRRTRYGGEWRDSVNITDSEPALEFEIDILDGSNVVRTIPAIASSTYIYTAADQTTDFGSPQSSIDIEIFQISAVVGRGTKAEATL